MLEAKGIKADSLFKQIKAAADQHIIIPEMVDWAHEIRLAANDERHPDEDDASAEDAAACVDFALALGEALFVLPARVTRGRKRARHDKP